MPYKTYNWFYTGPADINIGRASIKPIIERLATLADQYNRYSLH